MRNLFRAFTGLLPRRRHFVGAVVAHNANGTSTIQTASGQFRARGTTVAVGQQAEVEDGVVMRQAPSMTTVNIDV